MDYKKLGVKCGLEIHQQLDTDKLFIPTPSLIRDDNPDLIVQRKLRAVTGETGEKDAAASFEEFANKTFIYQGYYDTTCPIEFDEEPPRVMNADALAAVLQISTMLNCSLVDEVQVMRKIVVDGSNTSGFQRTALVGRHGSLKTEHGHVGIPTISLEEDSAKIVERNDENNTITYNLSRLGIPLIEIGTDPDITSPEMAKAVAAQLGMILRSAGTVKRGLGTIRQDLNVSITGGNRVEIKGAQDLRMIPKWVDFEILRQKNLLEIRDWLKKNKASIDAKSTSLSHLFANTRSKFVEQGLKNDHVMLGVKLQHCSGILGEEVQPGRRFGTELSDYAKRASGLKGLIHSDEDPAKYSLLGQEIESVRKELGCKPDDAFIMILGPEDLVEKALKAVRTRFEYGLSGVPKEVRKTNPDGSTTFMRPMPGAARMYPETDCVPIITEPLLKEIEIPELIDERAERYKKTYKISDDLALGLAKFDFSLLQEESFDTLVKKYKQAEPSFIAQTLLLYPKEVKKRYDVEFTLDHFKEVRLLIEKVHTGEITKDAFIELLPRLIKKEKIDYTQYKPVDDSILKKKIQDIVKKNKGAPFGALMGLCMKEFRGKVDGKKISELLKEIA
jgi:glutamyl-tRNA(Gln) amidotransferase subunit E